MRKPLVSLALLVSLAACADGDAQPVATTVTATVTAMAPPAVTVTEPAPAAVTVTTTIVQPPPVTDEEVSADPAEETGAEPSQETAEEETSAASAEDATEAEEEFSYPVYEIGEPFEFEDTALTVTGVEVVSEIATRDGGVLRADDGEELVLVETEYMNLGRESVDLTCSGLRDLYLQAFDTDGREMEPLFEDHQIPGNPECNDALLAGQESEWTTAFRMVEGGQPLGLSLTETNSFDNLVVVNFTDLPIEMPNN